MALFAYIFPGSLVTRLGLWSLVWGFVAYVEIRLHKNSAKTNQTHTCLISFLILLLRRPVARVVIRSHNMPEHGCAGGLEGVLCSFGSWSNTVVKVHFLGPNVVKRRHSALKRQSFYLVHPILVQHTSWHSGLTSFFYQRSCTEFRQNPSLVWSLRDSSMGLLGSKLPWTWVKAD